MASKTYPTCQLGANGPHVSAIGFGAMGAGAFYGASDDEETLKTLTYAADRGVTFWDTADIYGTSEAILGRWFKETDRRSDIFLATKFGSMDLSGPTPVNRPRSDPAYIKGQFERSLSALNTDHIDLYYQHRVDPDVPIEIVLETLRPNVESGKIKWLGLSECSIHTFRRAKAVKGLGEKIVAVQMEFSPFEVEIEKNGFADAANELGVAIVAYSPLCRGLVTGRYRSRADFGEGDFRLYAPRFSDENFTKNIEVADKFVAIGKKYGATASQVALAWILAEHPNFFPIPGSRSPERVEDNAKGAELQLTPEDLKEIRRLVDAADVQGTRYPADHTPQGDCIELNDWKGKV